VLFVANQPQRLQQFTLATGLALFATDIISAFAPSVTTVYLDLGLPLHAAVPADAYTPLPTLQALRSGALYSIQLNAIEGLVSFPSFHTIGALLFIWALFTVAYVRWIALAVNVALIVATPIVGAHYFIDLAGGAVVALCTIGAARWLSRRAQPATIATPQIDNILEAAGSRVSR
jgi:membrane-associated phospholipid phosphatase